MKLPDKVQGLLIADPESAKKGLDQLTPEKLLAPAKVVSPDDAMLVKSALYLKHGFLDQSHKISQKVETSEGSYWHAIMHRKEGDFSNSKYWYRRVGQHPIFSKMGSQWDPFQFVDKCAKGGSLELEEKEFNFLLDHTLGAALGKTN